ncbi:uncharacterized protein [Mobula birostris]|uniref:uncharacterized protein isoform X2 n=1 Tax=Mobula birostris TaxID=1983395 RepID=UPI003B283A92
MSVSNDAHLRVKVEDDAEAVIFNGAEMVDIQNGSSSPSIEDQSQVNNQKRYLAAVVYVQQPGVESVPGDSSANINKSAGNQLQECVPNREEASSEIRSCEARRTSGEYSYVYRPKRRKITVCNAPQMRTRDTGDYADYEENGDFVYDYSADYECASDMSESSFVTDQQRTLVEVLNYCQVMYAAIQRLDKKFDVLHRRVTEMHEGRTKPMFFKPRLMTSHGNSHQMSLTKMKMQKPAERQVRIRMPPPDQGICSSPLRIRVEKEPLNISVQSSTAQPLTNPETTYSCTRATSPPLPTIHSVLSLQEPSMQGSATAVGISDLVPVKTIVKQDTGVPKLSGANDTGRLYQDGYSSRDTETFVNGNTTNGTEQQSNLSEQLSCAPSSSAANMNFDYLGDPRRNIKVPAAFLIKARQKSKPKYAARYLIRMMFPRDVLMCSNMQGDKARGIKPLDSNRVNALREFLGTLFPTFDLNEEGKDWKTCVTSVNSMIRSLRYETQRAAMSAAEKQRRYRARRDADPARRSAYLEKQREAWHRLRAQGKVKTVTEMSERQKRSKRAYWRKAQQRSRERKNRLENLATPPDTYQDVSCPCTTKQSFECQCDISFGVQQKTPALPQADKSKDDEIQWGPHLTDQWCALKYDGKIYPGVIQEVTETHVQVKCMHHRGVNRFFWPLRDDVLWYLFEDIVRMIPPPKPVTLRHFEIDKDIWSSF